MTISIKNRTAAKGIMYAALSVVIWGITFVNTKYLLRSFSSLEILCARFVVAYIGLWCAFPHRLLLKNKKHELLFALAGLSGVTLYQFTENVAISYTSASNVSIIVSVCPMITAIILQLCLHEKHLTPRFLAGFVLSMCGIALVSFNGSAVLNLNPKGDLLALSSALCWGFYSLAVSKINALGYKQGIVTRRVFFWALVFMIPLVVIGVKCGGDALGTNGENAFLGGALGITTGAAANKARFTNAFNYVNILFLGLLASAFCFVSWNKACKALGTVKASMGIYLIPVVTLVFAFFFLGEKLTVMGFIGAALTIAGLFFANSGKKA